MTFLAIMWPYCGIRESILDADDPRLELPDWECIRGCTLGVASAIVCLIGGYAAIKIGIVFVKTRWYALNLLMLTLATLQCLMTTIKYVFAKEAKLTFTAGYLRGLQTLLTSANYARVANDGTEAIAGCIDAEFFATHFFNLLGFFSFYLTIVYFAAMGKQELECFHAHWLLMSVSQFLIVVLFSIPGLSLFRRLSSELNLRRDFLAQMNENQKAVIQQRHGLAVLLVFNFVGSSSQLVLDGWLQTHYADEKECVIFESGFQELTRIILKFLSYDAPVLATVYVYFWQPRQHFETDLEVSFDPLDGGSDQGLQEAFRDDLQVSLQET